MIVSSWRDLPDEPFLPRGGCQLWLAWLDQEDPSGYRSLLSQDETLRARRLRSPRLADRFTVGRGILRILLGRYLSVDPQDVIFTYGPHGRPEVACGTQAGFSFNLSHSEGLAVFAIARGVQVGVDVEAFHPLEDLDASASIFLSPGELEEFKALPSHQKPERFFTLWTSREAALKALGRRLCPEDGNFDSRISPSRSRSGRTI